MFRILFCLFIFFLQKTQKFSSIFRAHWGLYYSNGTLKPLLYDLIPVEAGEGISRPPRTLVTTSVTAPFSVYTEVFSPENPCSPENYSFYPTGWMGDLEDWTGDPSEVLDYACTESPYSGNTCIRITYSPGSEGWAGIYWQYPMNNWGSYPGYNISEATKLTFWARGEKGGENAEFKTGGISSLGKLYRDSFGSVSTGTKELTKEWKKYTINNLSEQNLSMVIGGFCWATNQSQNPDGCTIYLDEISFVGISVNFDTGLPKNPYPSIFGTHNGTIKPDNDILVKRLFTYSCPGTGGHTEYVKIWNATWSVTASWDGYKGDWYNITFNESFILEEGITYNYTIRTGSYPQIHHTSELKADGGVINCTKFTDANGKIYDNWIPAIKLFL